MEKELYVKDKLIPFYSDADKLVIPICKSNFVKKMNISCEVI